MLAIYSAVVLSDVVLYHRFCAVVALLSDSVTPEVRELLTNRSLLGRLHLSVTDDLNEEGKVDALYAFGGRSVTVFRYKLSKVDAL